MYAIPFLFYTIGDQEGRIGPVLGIGTSVEGRWGKGVGG
jgi:hypothetical protein